MEKQEKTKQLKELKEEQKKLKKISFLSDELRNKELLNTVLNKLILIEEKIKKIKKI